jgi:signal transduction histidine kinase
VVTIAILLAAAAVTVEAGRTLRDARRARRLNRALHELRRPLQAITLSLDSAAPDVGAAAACLEQARAALRDLDAVVNGGREPRAVRRAAVSEVLGALALRWRFADVEVEVDRHDVEVEADVDRLGAALDNLVANALRHGSGVIRVRARAIGGKARFEVRDGGPAAPTSAACRRDRRHGHGLRVVADVAAGNGGEALPAGPTPGGGTLAAISLPVSGGAAGA